MNVVLQTDPVFYLDGYNGSDVIYKWQESRLAYTFKDISLSHYDINPMDRYESKPTYLYGE